MCMCVCVCVLFSCPFLSCFVCLSPHFLLHFGFDGCVDGSLSDAISCMYVFYFLLRVSSCASIHLFARLVI
jgi:hypothetical protein